ncbi:hypothetical protein MXMO3_02519 [Maritalea myrionectae]|uniref:CENP-V/GFA domain-containing protein n=1 Tax=Maritalea myrionectae TaxID=454601 RepID=A0A2R4MG58_9HYPH|nr:GFA family protein [Maritalea myrionectae]AVX05031.1 hypothetical protein MXMO3_02519 [Maritalea myrionectae]
MSETIHTGGCQCGAVRYKALGDDFGGSICHCRMCQKQSGSYFGAFATFSNDKVTWTRGQPSYFQSSTVAKRGFCKDCGTPLTYEWDRDGISLAIGSFDDPNKVAPTKQLDYAARIKSFDDLHKLPIRPEDPEFQAQLSAMKNFQHPDHDTAEWPDSQD